MKTLGTQLICDLTGCDAERLASVVLVQEIMEEAAREAGATIVGAHFKQFDPHGVSGFIMIAESHLAIHTWPEHGYAAVDVFTCGPMDPQAAIRVLSSRFAATHTTTQHVDRGV